MKKSQLLTRCKQLGIYNNPNLHHDFLATCNQVEEFGETDKYFFKHVDVHVFSEVRFFKKSGRVSVSNRKTLQA